MECKPLAETEVKQLCERVTYHTHMHLRQKSKQTFEILGKGNSN
jgi:hypothetical protein